MEERLSHNPEAPPQAGGDDPSSVRLTIEVGRSRVTLEEVEQLRQGSVVLLDELASDPVAIFAGEERIGRGEIVRTEGCYGVRVTELHPRWANNR